jgi:hypothetical protein
LNYLKNIQGIIIESYYTRKIKMIKKLIRLGVLFKSFSWCFILFQKIILILEIPLKNQKKKINKNPKIILEIPLFQI